MSAPRRTQRSPEAQAWRAWYGLARWQARRLQQLKAQPLCERCLKANRVVAASVAHHLVPHKGDPQAFWFGALASSCKPCHDGAEQSFERRGYSDEIGRDGWPVDPKNPAYAKVADLQLRRIDSDVFFPKYLRPSAIPLTIVCGPPAAGKSTYVRERASPTDIVIDLDEIIRAEFGANSARTPDGRMRAAGLRKRNAMLAALSTRGKAKRAWFITTAAKPETRKQWAERLKPEAVVVLATPIDVCLRRVQEAKDRRRFSRHQGRIIAEWWERYAPWPEGERTISQ